MTGNVSEWVKDWYSSTYYANSPLKNPQGPKTGKRKLLKGGDVVGTQSYNILYRRGRGEKSDAEQGGVRCVINQKRPVHSR